MTHDLGIGAVLWDMDGTLVDTEPLWERTTREVVRDLGGAISLEDHRLLCGASVVGVCEILARSVPDLDPTTTFDEIERRVLVSLADELVVVDGAKRLLDVFASLSIPQVIVSASRASVVERVLRVVGAQYFHGVIADDSGPEPKPAPAPYLAAAGLVGVPIERCLVFEDSELGLASARSAGALVWNVAESPLGGVGLEDIAAFARRGRCC